MNNPNGNGILEDPQRITLPFGLLLLCWLKQYQ